MKFILSITGFLLLAGCATGYQAHTWSGGYKDKALGENHYYVEYLGNGTNSTETVNTYWDMRAKELCPNGYTEVTSELGKNNSFAAGTAGVSFDHPWKKAEIKCN
ncbi:MULTISPECIES: CC0125/CC1285 family lipoprotein [Pseudoalteromonas]|uniref:Lipoprotein n=1 Tax=Pseudoalteromonas aliena SW19 TaxID=1314866 RepID=A0ABR9E0V4_9GAMM|nr:MULTISPECIES: hypothetical protein [Pseudoalteromonas]KTF13125.1 hypothetical protein ATS74_19455 [Pseudoalteromonas sp. H103]MBE0359064.1 hypothetical protein [Pseudoalteromonas aliena SW19]MDC9519677.1 hypothetical protein [Pseudoalteromonas sp. Angola-31]|tara:strand:- start:227 stop:541 length:315 start_codon:yes stop_codon:yes gene_type:complete